jgi:hypothetical protein
LPKTLTCIFPVLMCLLCLCPAPCPADTVVTNSAADDTMSPGTPIDSLELLDLGIDPNLFLFTGNTMFDYDGIYELEIIAANVDPSTTASLAGVPVQQTLVIIGDSGGAPQNSQLQALPNILEPSTVALCIAGCLLIVSYRIRRGNALGAESLVEVAKLGDGQLLGTAAEFGHRAQQIPRVERR